MHTHLHTQHTHMHNTFIYANTLVGHGHLRHMHERRCVCTCMSNLTYKAKPRMSDANVVSSIPHLQKIHASSEKIETYNFRDPSVSLLCLNELPKVCKVYSWRLCIQNRACHILPSVVAWSERAFLIQARLLLERLLAIIELLHESTRLCVHTHLPHVNIKLQAHAHGY